MIFISILLSIFCLFILVFLFNNTPNSFTYELSHASGKGLSLETVWIQTPALPSCLLYNKSPNSESSFIVCNKATWKRALQGGSESQMKSCISITAAINSPLSPWDRDTALSRRVQQLGLKGFLCLVSIILFFFFPSISFIHSKNIHCPSVKHQGHSILALLSTSSSMTPFLST